MTNNQSQGTELQKKEVWFCLTFKLKGMHIGHRQGLPVCVPLPSLDDGEIVLRLETADERSSDGPAGFCCEASLKRKVNIELLEMLELVTKGLFPQDSPPVVTLPFDFGFEEVIDTQGNLTAGWLPTVDMLPRRLQSLTSAVELQLREAIHNYIRVLRWVQRAPGNRNPLSFREFQWSTDREKWHPLILPLKATVGFDVGLNIREEPFGKALEVWRSGVGEPLCHDLIREAFDVAGSNPRSALLIGVAALETGLKEYLEQRIPDVDVVLDRVPSPPVLALIQEVIPQLHDREGAAVKGFPLADKDKKYLRKWINIRNSVTHGRRGTVRGSDVVEFFGFVRTLLYRLDLTLGRVWAAAFAYEEDNAQSGSREAQGAADC